MASLMGISNHFMPTKLYDDDINKADGGEGGRSINSIDRIEVTMSCSIVPIPFPSLLPLMSKAAMSSGV